MAHPLLNWMSRRTRPSSDAARQITCRPGESTRRSPHEKEWAALFAIVAIILAYVQVLTIHRVHNFLTFYPIDTAEPTQALWNTLDGRPFHQTISGEGYNDLSYHCFVSLLLNLPLLAIAPTGLTLLLVKNALVVLTCIPMYRIIRYYTDSVMIAFLLLFAYLSLGFLRAFTALETHFGLFALPFLLSAYYYYLKRHFAPFAVCALICLLTKEHYAFIIPMFGILALIERRSRRWILWPTLGCVAFFVSYRVLNEYYLIPSSQTRVNLYKTYYGAWGDSFTSCVLSILFNPVEVLKCLFEPNKWFFLFYVTFPLLPFLILRPGLMLLATPCLAIVFMMTGRGEDIFHPGMMDYYCEASVLSFVALVQVVASRKTGAPLLTATGFVIAIFSVFLCWFALGFNSPSRYMLEYNGLAYRIDLLVGCAWFGMLVFMILFVCPISDKSSILWTSVLIIVQNLCFHLFIFSSSMLNVESYCFNINSEVRNRNTLVRKALSNVPRSAPLAVPSKYAIVAAARPRLYIYNATEPIESQHYFRPDSPMYILLDALNYNTIFDAAYLNTTWNRTYLQTMWNDRTHWDVVFLHNDVCLLKRRAISSSR